MPDRARKYFGDRLSGVTRNNFAEVCDKLAMASGHDDSDLVAILAEHLEEIIGNVDTCVQIVANGVYKGQEMSRDAAVIETQAWELAFDEKGRSFASERGFVGSAHGLVDFLLAEYQFEYRRDPIRSWKAQASKLKSKTCPHMALEHYQSFVRGTGAIRASLEQSAAAAEAEIEAASDRMREK